MTQRLEVSVIENIWHDAQLVDQTDMQVEQNHNNQIPAAIIQNHFGSGVLLSSVTPNIIFDSDILSSAQVALLASNGFDGVGISPTTQPTDINLGNQLEIELTGSKVFGRLSTKVAIIGVTFDGTLQINKLYFYRNEKQVISTHYKQILSIFFNDFKGNSGCSRNNGGRIVIRETSSFELSRDPIMFSQEAQPDIFWRDWKLPAGNFSLYNTIQSGIGSLYTVDALNINITGLTNNILLAGDVTSQVGEKFIANTNNIQKITLLLGATEDTSKPDANMFDWTGQLLVSIYPLQTSVSCPTDIVPQLAIDFDPANQPLAQLSFDQQSLKDLGYILTNVLQPVDLIFSNTQLANTLNSKIIPNNYYAITLKRVGSDTVGNILIGTGNNKSVNSRVTLFNNVWVDVPDQDLWFQVWTDAAKIADGQGYDNGNGIIITKTITDPTTGATIDNQSRYFSLSDAGQNVLNIGVIQATLKQSLTAQDVRTGNDIFSRQQFVPSFSFVNQIGLKTLQNVTEPLTIGSIVDSNSKSNPTLTKSQTIPGLAKGDNFCIVNPDADLLSLNLLGSKLIPDGYSAFSYKIYRSTLCTDLYGDTNGDGIIDLLDITRATALIGESIYYTSTQTKIRDGNIQTLELLRSDVDGDGYVTATDVSLMTQYAGKQISAFPAGSSFTHLCLQVQQNIGRWDGYYDCNGLVRLDGYNNLNLVDPSALTIADLGYDGYLANIMIEADPTFTTIPFPGTTYQIIPQPFWQPYLLLANNNVKLVPSAFSYSNAIVPNNCGSPSTTLCSDKDLKSPANDPGRNDFFVPSNLLIGSGEILRPDGSNYKVDFEVATFILELPAVPLSETSMDIFGKLVADRGDGWSGSGVGVSAAKYSDCSTVKPGDLAAGRVRFSVSLQAFYPNLDGYDPGLSGISDGYGIVVDDIIGIYMDQNTGILTLHIKDQAVDPVYLTLVSKIQVQVFLKKAGFNNPVITIKPNEIQGLISS